MSQQGDLMRRALKRNLFPELKALGFSGRTSSFQRANPKRIDLLWIQYWKYGGEFILEFGARERGSLQTTWGEIIPEEKLEVVHINPLYRARLEQLDSQTGFRGFVFSGFGGDAAQYDALAKQVVLLLPQVDDWLRNRAVGPNIFVFQGNLRTVSSETV